MIDLLHVGFVTILAKRLVSHCFFMHIPIIKELYTNVQFIYYVACEAWSTHRDRVSIVVAVVRVITILVSDR